jgi:hypothetical protein
MDAISGSPFAQITGLEVQGSRVQGSTVNAQLNTGIHLSLIMKVNVDEK